MTFSQFILTRTFWKNLLWIILSGLALSVVILFLLKAYTRHGNNYDVPDYRGMMPDEVENHPLSSKFRFEIIDTIFSDDLVKGSIAAQDPLPGSKVKQNRRIFLTVVSDESEQVAMPNLLNITLRLAVARLETYGLKVGQTVYVPSSDQDAVLKQSYRGREVSEGTMIPKGAIIDLDVGQGYGYEFVKVPVLIGLTHYEVINILHQTGLNIGMENFETSTDTNAVRVYQQVPSPSRNARTPLGSSVDVWYKLGTIEEFETLKSRFINDTLGTEESFD